MKKQHVYTVIGAVAFVIGGIVARAKAIEMTEIIENTISKKPADPAE